MKIHVLALAVLLTAAQAGRAQVKDLAELFPARTRVYLEFNGIAELVKEVRGLVKGSCLEDPPKTLEKFAELTRNEFFFAENLDFAMLLCPEGLSEISRFRGGAIAVTGVSNDPKKGPEIVGVLSAGQSNVPVLFARYLMCIPLARKVGEVEGVRMYRSREQDLEKLPLDGQQPKLRDSGPVVALMPGIVIVGSSNDAVGDVIRRLKGKGKEPSLASVADFKKSADLRAQPGLFAYSDGGGLVSFVAATHRFLRQRPRPSGYQLEGQIQKFEDKRELPRDDKKNEVALIQKEKGIPTLAQEFIDLAGGFRNISFNLTLKDGSAQVNGRATLDAKGKNPWEAFFSPRTLDLELLRFMPKHSPLALFAALPEGTSFWDKLGKAAPLLETELSLALGKDLLKIARVGVIDAYLHEPVLLIEATDAGSAPQLAQTLGKLLKKETQTKGRFLALAKDKKLAATVLAGNGIGADKKMLDGLKDHQQAQVLLAWSLGRTVVEAIREDAKNQNQLRIFDKKVEPPKKAEDKEKVFLQEPGQKQPDDKDGPPLDPVVKLKKLAARTAKSLEPFPPFVLSLSKKSDHLILTGRQSQLQTLVPRLIDALVEWELTSSRRYNYALEMPAIPVPKKD
jgi:hypothetical protein